tara:strand:- start:412 stop:762 length:351 start_codon:yes stop_codon:yes gene_type:complete
MIDQLADLANNLTSNTINLGFTTLIDTLDFGMQMIRYTPDLINQNFGLSQIVPESLRGSGIFRQASRITQMLWRKYDSFIWYLKDDLVEKRQYKLPGKPYEPLPDLDINLKTLNSL